MGKQRYIRKMLTKKKAKFGMLTLELKLRRTKNIKGVKIGALMKIEDKLQQ